MSFDGKATAKTLAEDGVVAIEGYYDSERCHKLFSEISDMIDQADTDVVKSGEYSYSELANWDGTVVLERTGLDDGMIDVFNLDVVVPEVAAFKNDGTIHDIINQASLEEYSPDNVNAYWNRSVTKTRDFHADTYSGKFKSFLYLTDVLDRSHGPFCYIKGSHNISGLREKASFLINKIKGRRLTDAVFYDKGDIECYTAPKGTLIIANQSGYHRGYPQEEGQERMLLTTSYTPTK